MRPAGRWDVHLVAVCKVGDVRDGQAKRFGVAGRELVVYHCNDAYFANEGTCTHALASLEEGTIDRVRCTVECALHGAEFDLRTGEALIPPAVLPVKVFPVTIEGGQILVELDD
jgi:3-phenylpropionate/trans-cinnamate dioxygenase ferredoxin subunit